MSEQAMTDADPADDLDPLWESLPKFLENAGDDWALREVLDAGVAGCTRDDDTPEGLMIRHNPDGTRQLVQVNIDSPDTVIRAL
jgi:hypothetical protein